MFKTISTMTLLGLATLSAAFAESSQPIQAKVPFAFTVQDTTLPAGNYQLTYNNSAHSLWIRGLDHSSGGAFATAVPANASDSSNVSGRLVFQCYGKTCYLAQVWQGAIRGGGALQLSKTAQERRLSFLTRVVSITIVAK